MWILLTLGDQQSNIESLNKWNFSFFLSFSSIALLHQHHHHQHFPFAHQTISIREKQIVLTFIQYELFQETKNIFIFIERKKNKYREKETEIKVLKAIRETENSFVSFGRFSIAKEIALVRKSHENCYIHSIITNIQHLFFHFFYSFTSSP